MERVTLRVPSGLLRAYDAAEGNRSALMRRALSEYVEDGRLNLPNDDLAMLAKAETAADSGQLTRRRATFRARCREYFGKFWQRGGVDPATVDELAETWRDEAVLFGPEYVAYVDAVVSWWHENHPMSRGSGDPEQADRHQDMPDPDTFIARADPETVDVRDRIAQQLEQAAQDGKPRDEAVEAMKRFNDSDEVEAAAELAYGDAARADGGQA